MRRCTEALPSPRTKLASSSIAPYRRRNGRPVARVAGGAGSYEATAALQTPGRSGPPAVRDRDAVFCVNAPHLALHTAWRLSVGCSMRQRAPRQPIERTLENESGSVLIDDFGAASAEKFPRAIVSTADASRRSGSLAATPIVLLPRSSPIKAPRVGRCAAASARGRISAAMSEA